MKEHDKRVVHSSKAEDWETPQWLFDFLNDRFAFTLDAAADEFNTKCDNYFSEKNNALLQSWQGHNVFINPPFSREYGKRTKNYLPKWVHKMWKEALYPNTLVVALLPARTGTQWWHPYVTSADEVIFVKGRLHFSNSPTGAPFNSAIVIWGRDNLRHRTKMSSLVKWQGEWRIEECYNQPLITLSDRPKGVFRGYGVPP